MRMLLLTAVALAWGSSLAGQAGDASSLIGPTWAAVELAGVPVPAEPAARQPTIQFVAGGRVAGTDGCNRVSAPYVLKGQRIAFGPVIATRMACPGAEDVTERFAKAIEGTAGWRIAGGRLEFYGATGTPLVIFAPRPEAGAAAGPASPVPAAPLTSKVFDWTSLTPVPIPNGERRQVLDGPTPTVDLLHVHVTTLAAGKASGEAVRHLQEEVLIVKEGEVEVSLDGTTQTVGPGSILFFAAGAVTRLRNAGATPATYYVVYYKTGKTPLK